MNFAEKIRLYLHQFRGSIRGEDRTAIIQAMTNKEGGNFQLSCGAMLCTNKRKRNEDVIRAVIKCNQCCVGRDCRAIGATMAGLRLADCKLAKLAVKLIADWNKKQRERILRSKNET